jgi:hypothetical protein
MKKLLLSATMAACTSVVAQVQPIQATVMCDQDGTILKQLQEKYNEVPAVAGIINGGATMSVFVNKQTGTWTVIGIKGDLTCMYLDGDNFKEILKRPNM